MKIKENRSAETWRVTILLNSFILRHLGASCDTFQVTLILTTILQMNW